MQLINHPPVLPCLYPRQYHLLFPPLPAAAPQDAVEAASDSRARILQVQAEAARAAALAHAAASTPSVRQ